MGRPNVFSLANVLAALAALVFGFVCFMSLHFYALGDKIPWNIAWAALIALLLSVLAIGAGVFKRASRNFTACLMWEILFLIVFTSLTALFAYEPFPHYFAVSERKKEILPSFTQVDSMFAEYESYAGIRKERYASKFREAVGRRDGSENEFDTTALDILLGGEYDSIENKYNGIKKETGNWRKIIKLPLPVLPMDIVNIDRVQAEQYKLLDSLTEISKIRAPKERDNKEERVKDFEYNLSSKNIGNAKSIFTKRGEREPTLFSVVAAILLYVLMLTPYLSSKRSEKPTVLKKTGDNMYKNRRDTKINIKSIEE